MRVTIFLVLAIAALGSVGITTAIMSSGPTPAHAAAQQRQCPNSPGEICITGGMGPQFGVGGQGGRVTQNLQTGDFSISGGRGHVGGLHETGNIFTGQVRCVGRVCS